MSTTQTGIPIIDCEECGYRHPITRQHCPTCGKASLFGHKNCGWEKQKAKVAQMSVLPVVEAKGLDDTDAGRFLIAARVAEIQGGAE